MTSYKPVYINTNGMNKSHMSEICGIEANSKQLAKVRWIGLTVIIAEKASSLRQICDIFSQSQKI